MFLGSDRLSIRRHRINNSGYRGGVGSRTCNSVRGFTMWRIIFGLCLVIGATDQNTALEPMAILSAIGLGLMWWGTIAVNRSESDDL